jgi:TolB-like protein
MRKFLLCLPLFLGSVFFCSAQDIVPFAEALNKTMEYLTTRIPEKSKVVVLNFQSEYPALSEFVIDEITTYLVNTDSFTMVDRRSLTILQEEMNFQLSGEVSDETAQTIGQKLGAQTIISGAVSYLGDFYRLRVQAIEVQSARIQGSQLVNIQPNRLLASLTNRPLTEPEALKILYLGIRSGSSTHFYTLNKSYWGDGGDAGPSWTGEAAASLSLQIVPIFAVQTELVFSGDTLTVSGNPLTVLSNANLTIPILGKFTFRPGPFFIALFGGGYFSIPLNVITLYMGDKKYEYNTNTTGGIIAGGSIGRRFGPGTVFADIRYAAGLQGTEISGDWGSKALYQQGRLSYSLGYEIGFGSRKRKEP